MEKTRKAEHKAKAKGEDERSRLFVIDFNGSMDAKEVASLREEVSAVIGVARPGTRCCCASNPAAAWCMATACRLPACSGCGTRTSRLTVAIDKVAASGGYMMACVADKILAAPFAIVGSIGVIAQMPNFNKLLKKHDIEFEMHTAGQYKRTITMFGENDDQGREKFREELGPSTNSSRPSWPSTDPVSTSTSRPPASIGWRARPSSSAWWMRSAPAMTTCWPRPAITRWSASATAKPRSLTQKLGKQAALGLEGPRPPGQQSPLALRTCFELTARS